MKQKFPVLFLYPTQYRVTGLPVGIASIMGVLRQNAFEVKVFDTAFYRSSDDINQNEIRARKGISKAVVNEDLLIDNSSDMFDDLVKLINEYSPHLIAVTLLQPTYETGISLTRFIKSNFPDLMIVAGGVFPTLSPEIVFNERSIDAVCVGEGETPLLELCKALSVGEDISHIPSFWFKWKGKSFKNEPVLIDNLDELPFPDYSGFDARLFYKPMQGRLYRMINIETTRGCPYDCTYCSAPALRNFFKRHNKGRYYRKLSMNRIIEQIYFQIEKYTPEFLYFSSETFLSMDDDEFSTFINEYSKILIPFWFQTRFETITEDRLQALKDVGMYWLSIGLEHGNEEFRKRILKRRYSNDKVLEGGKILKKLDIGASINNIIGFPDETEELIRDTIRMNKKLWELQPKIESNVFVFTPYAGSELFELCKDKGLISTEISFKQITLGNENMLTYSDKWIGKLCGLSRTFNLYVKLPEEYFPKIAKAEEMSPAGDQIFEELLTLARGR